MPTYTLNDAREFTRYLGGQTNFPNLKVNVCDRDDLITITDKNGSEVTSGPCDQRRLDFLADHLPDASFAAGWVTQNRKVISKEELRALLENPRRESRDIRSGRVAARYCSPDIKLREMFNGLKSGAYSRDDINLDTFRTKLEAVEEMCSDCNDLIDRWSEE
jgi:hypothetical protein